MSDGLFDETSAAGLAQAAEERMLAHLRRAEAVAKIIADAQAAVASLRAEVGTIASGLGVSHRWSGTLLQLLAPGGVYGEAVDLVGPVGPAGPMPSFVVGSVTAGDTPSLTFNPEPLTECDGTEMVRVRKGNRWRWLATALFGHPARLDAIEARVAALEARPQEVVPFSGSLTTGLLAIGTKTFTISGLTGLVAGERVVVEPAAALPPGVSIAGARVVADGTVEVTLAALVALTASRTIPLTITALR